MKFSNTDVLDTVVKGILSALLCCFFSLADKHKMERFLRPDAPTVVSVYAPITFSPAGVLLFKQRNDGEGEENGAFVLLDYCLISS